LCSFNCDDTIFVLLVANQSITIIVIIIIQDALLEHGFIVGLEMSQQKSEKKKMLNKANQLVRSLVKTVTSTNEVYEVMVCGHTGVGKVSFISSCFPIFLKFLFVVDFTGGSVCAPTSC
jgi:uncharacterized membrane protein